MATLYQSRLKKKEDAMKEKYFVSLMQGGNTAEGLLGNVAGPCQGQATNLGQGKGAELELINSSNTSIIKLDNKYNKLLFPTIPTVPTVKTPSLRSKGQATTADSFSATLPAHANSISNAAKLTYNNELLKIRKIEEYISGVKFDKFGLVTFKSLENKIKKLGVLYTMAELASLSVKFLAKIKRDQKKVSNTSSYGSTAEYVGGAASIYGRVPALAPQQGSSPFATPDNVSSRGAGPVKVKKRFYKMLFKKFEFNNINNDLQFFTLQIKKDKGRVKKSKLFKVFAKTYLNIFKFKVSHPIFNKLKLR